MNKYISKDDKNNFDNFIKYNFIEKNVINDFENKNIILLSKTKINNKYINLLHEYEYGFIYYYGKLDNSKYIVICEI